MRGLIMTIVGVMVMGLGVAPSAVAAAPPPTLTGEFLNAGGGEAQIMNAHCAAPGSTSDSSFTFKASGFAGPTYAGSSTEYGYVVLGPMTPIPFGGTEGPVKSFVAYYTINSTAPVARVTGIKEGSGGTGMCSSIDGYAVNGVSLRYQALIGTSHGWYADHGTGRVDFSSMVANLGETPFFNEVFQSSQATTIRVGRDS